MWKPSRSTQGGQGEAAPTGPYTQPMLWVPGGQGHSSAWAWWEAAGGGGRAREHLARSCALAGPWSGAEEVGGPYAGVVTAATAGSATAVLRSHTGLCLKEQVALRPGPVFSGGT